MEVAQGASRANAPNRIVNLWSSDDDPPRWKINDAAPQLFRTKVTIYHLRLSWRLDSGESNYGKIRKKPTIAAA